MVGGSGGAGVGGGGTGSMETSGNQGSPSTSMSSRTVEKVFDDSQYTGEIILVGRKLKFYPLSASKYDLVDTTLVDLSKNRFNDVPNQVCDYHSLEQLNCYHNVIKTVPFVITQLQNLVHLNLSRNLISVLPPFICGLEQLQVLQVNNNRLVSLPEEIGSLQNLMELDVASNQITHLPVQMGDLRSLKSLNVRRNLLVELPLSLCRLKLCRLDFSCNRIAHIPCEFHRMDSLEELSLENNPLLSPPAHACTRGLVHVKKFLSVEALRDERRRGVIQNDANLRSNMPNVKRFSSHSTVNSDETSIQSENGDSDRLRAGGMFDSGYSTTDSSSRKLIIASAEDLQRHRTENESKRLRAEKLKSQELEVDERRRGVFSSPDEMRPGEQKPRENGNFPGLNIGLQTQSFKEVRTVSTPVVVPLRRLVSDADYDGTKNSSSPQLRPTNANSRTNSTLHEHPSSSSSSASTSSGCIPIPVHHITSNSSTTPDGYGLPLEEELRRRHDALAAQHRREALNVHHRIEEEKLRRQFGSESDQHQHSTFYTRADGGLSLRGIDAVSSSFSENFANSKKSTLPLACQKALDAMSTDLNSMNPVFTIRRNLQHAQEELEQIQELRRIIESLLKVKLPEDLPGALRDGVVLCHLANHVLPRSVPTVHVPSPAVPNLSHAKCRKNVENFLVACRRMGIDQEFLCSCDDIIEELRPARITKIVRRLLAYQPTPFRDHVISLCCLSCFVLTCLLLFLFPLPS